eukprot:4274665-Prymnesium_polylepis.1
MHLVLGFCVMYALSTHHLPQSLCLSSVSGFAPRFPRYAQSQSTIIACLDLSYKPLFAGAPAVVAAPRNHACQSASQPCAWQTRWPLE